MKYRKILLAYNGSQEGKRALLECADLAGFLQAETHLLAVASMPPSLFLTEGFDSSQAGWIGDSFTIINDTYLAPNNIEVNMMFRHLLPGESTNLAKRYNRENISDGRWITNYAGHGGRGNWQTLDKEDLRLLTNADALTINVNFACDTGWLDDPTYNSLIEDFTLIADKGAVAALGASRSSTASDYNQVQIDAQVKYC